jgi:hypothetical protein
MAAALLAALALLAAAPGAARAPKPCAAYYERKRRAQDAAQPLPHPLTNGAATRLRRRKARRRGQREVRAERPLASAPTIFPAALQPGFPPLSPAWASSSRRCPAPTAPRRCGAETGWGALFTCFWLFHCFVPALPIAPPPAAGAPASGRTGG